MKRQFDQVLDFHRKFGCHIEDAPLANPCRGTSDVRARLIQEELDEYMKAVSDEDVVGVADALSDLLYVLLGTYIAHGLHEHAEELFDAVHRNNMSKLDGNGVPILRRDGKILKPENWAPPDLASILENTD